MLGVILSAALTLATFAGSGVAQVQSQGPSSWPHNYTGLPSEPYSPAWQSYFEVTQPLPNASFPLSRNWAGNVGVNRAGFPNDTLFFWAWERENGSLTASADERSSEPWGIWLNGGPGSSSMVGLLWENGPLHVADNYSLYANENSWHKLADYIWLDQPVGTGFSTASAAGYIVDEDQMAVDFWGFVSNLVKIFPSLAKRPLHLTGESYAGTYIPYITKAYFSLQNPPTKLVKIAIGDGAIGAGAEFVDAPTVQIIETFPQIIGYDPEVFDYFATQSHLCGYDLNLTYPQAGGKFPTLNGSPNNILGRAPLTRSALRARISKIHGEHALEKREVSLAERMERRELGRRSLAGRPNGTLDPYYGCSLLGEMWDYAVNYTYPWNTDSQGDTIDVYDIPDALNPEAPADLTVFLNDGKTQAALHAPTSKFWQESVEFVFQNGSGDPSDAPMKFFDQLAANASAHGIAVVIYSGNDDSLVSHWGSEVIIQNTTFGGIQGFSQKPSAVWTTDDGAFAGIVHTERNWTYALVAGAGHLIPQAEPVAAYVLARDFIFGTNSTGLVANGSASASPAGATATLEGMVGDVLRGEAPIYAGAGTTQTTVMPASASVAAWNSFIATRWGSSTGSGTAATGTSSTGGGEGGKTSAAAPNIATGDGLFVTVAVLMLAIW